MIWWKTVYSLKQQAWVTENMNSIEFTKLSVHRHVPGVPDNSQGNWLSLIIDPASWCIIDYSWNPSLEDSVVLFNQIQHSRNLISSSDVFLEDNVMDDPFVMDNPFLGLFLCLAVCGVVVVVVGEGWVQSQTAPAGSRPGTGGWRQPTQTVLSLLNQLLAPALYSSDQKYKSCRLLHQIMLRER